VSLFQAPSLGGVAFSRNTSRGQVDTPIGSKCSKAQALLNFKIISILGGAMQVEDLSCRGEDSKAQSL
jgi:hypothetical protein